MNYNYMSFHSLKNERLYIELDLPLTLYRTDRSPLYNSMIPSGIIILSRVVTETFHYKEGSSVRKACLDTLLPERGQRQR